MAADIGGQLETIPRKQSLFGPDYLYLAILILVAASVHIWLVRHTAVPARDSLGYARIAINISNPNHDAEDGKPRSRIDVIRDAEQPPGYPVAVWFAEKMLRRVTNLTDAERGLLATQVANATAAVLLVVPLYLIGRILFGRSVGFAGAMIFEVLPVPARITSDGLSEGVYLLVVTTAIALAVRAARKPTIGGFLLCGLATGASYLVRPEGLMVAMAVGSVILTGWLSRRWPRDVALGRLAALGVGVALIAVPYMVLIGGFTKKPTGTNLFAPEAPPIWRGQPGAQVGGGSSALFAAWWDQEKDEGRSRTLWALEAVWSETNKSLHYFVGVMAVIALVVYHRQLAMPDAGMWVLIVLGIINLLLLVFLAARIGYVSERHTTLFTMICCVFAAAAIEPLGIAIERTPVLGWIVFFPKGMPLTILGTIILIALPYTIKPMHPQRVGHKHAGLWLAERIQKDDWLIDPLSWGEWYAGRTLYKTPVCHGTPEFVWVIIEKKSSSPHSRLPLWNLAKEITVQHDPFYRWPADAPKDGPAIEVYRLRFVDVPNLRERLQAANQPPTQTSSH